MEKGQKVIWLHMQGGWDMLGQWVQAAIHCWAQVGLLQGTLAPIRLRLAAVGERARGHRPPRCGLQPKSRDQRFLVPGSGPHQHHPLWDLVLLGQPHSRRLHLALGHSLLFSSLPLLVWTSNTSPWAHLSRLAPLVPRSCWQ